MDLREIHHDDDKDDEDKVEADSASDIYFDALDSFIESDDDGEIFFDLPPSLHLESASTPLDVLPSSASTLRRRRQPPPEGTDPAPKANLDSPADRQPKIELNMKRRVLGSDTPASSAITSDQVSAGRRDGRPGVSRESGATSRARDNEVAAADAGSVPPWCILEFSADLVIKAVFFQMTLLVSFVKTTFWLFHCSFLCVTDPLGTLYRARDGAKARVSEACKSLYENILPLMFGRLIRQRETWKLVVMLTWGFFWSLYVCLLLFGILAASFLGASLIMRRVVEEPIQMTEELSFDYTKTSPEALVPIVPCVGCLVSSKEFSIVTHEFRRLAPPNQKLQLTISLTLPESDYNRNLGVFQVRVELLTINGNITSSSRQPCILRFKSSHIRFVETFLKSMFLLAGYSSETQVLSLRMRGLTEGTKPTICVRVTLEQRAEFRPGAGIPEIYSASMKLEVELPFFKRMIWNWRKTVFIWTSMMLFIMQLLILLVCCRPVIFPRGRSNGGTPRRP
ncbi:unnamed protein product [Musa acuminata subsp. burmannicoides]